MSRLLGKRLHQYLYDQKKRFKHWRTQTKRETKFKLLGLGRRIRYQLGLTAQLLTKIGMGKTVPKFLPSYFIGPTNSANQATEWARVLSHAGASAESLRISSDPSAEWFTTSRSIDRESWLKLPERIQLVNRVAKSSDIVLFESLRPMFRIENVRDGRHQVLEDLDLMKKIGKRVGVVFHGSDIRDPDAHAARYSFSPFNTDRPELLDLRKRSSENREMLPSLRARNIPLFVTTRDLLREIPDAHWLPVVIDFDKFHAVSESFPIYQSSKLRVLYLPSRSWLKSAEIILPILEKLDSEGVIEFIRPTTVPHDEIPQVIAQADLIIDQMMGVIGVFAIESLAAGRLVMSFIDADHGAGTPDEITSAAPIISINPFNLEPEVRRVAHERPHADGRDFARRWHDGSESIRVLGAAFRWRI